MCSARNRPNIHREKKKRAEAGWDGEFVGSRPGVCCQRGDFAHEKDEPKQLLPACGGHLPPFPFCFHLGAPAVRHFTCFPFLFPLASLRHATLPFIFLLCVPAAHCLFTSFSLLETTNILKNIRESPYKKSKILNWVHFYRFKKIFKLRSS